MRLFSGSLTNNRVTPGDEGGSRKLRRYLPCSQSWPPAPCAPLTHLRDLHAPDAKGTTVSPRESSGAPWHVSPLLWPRCGLSVRQQVQPGPGKGTTGPRGDDQSRRHEHLKEFAASQFDVKGRSRGQHKEPSASGGEGGKQFTTLCSMIRGGRSEVETFKPRSEGSEGTSQVWGVRDRELQVYRMERQPWMHSKR
ncbi:uncharacterized protein LOC116662571 isoform X3 [Camelus ferus]|uniref:Uncharacterized protein LOC116662571 isoform X3 n=1 Tax=Camelus ferus TaxID=419612 RepID=A0A8B8SQM9_CAMFR|nr:uncharacterized protein LOC116662571 isoform X3 [Camelus ferus]